MLNPFLTADAKRLSLGARTLWTQRLRQALQDRQEHRAIDALAQGADPHATDAHGELLVAHALERHQPRLLAAFCAAGGQYVAKDAPGGWFIQASPSGATSRRYASHETGVTKMKADFADFCRVATSLQQDHTTTARRHPNRRVACDLTNPRAREHALLSVMDIVRQLWDADSGEPVSA
jgi:hypothetical protein